jgi:hypothetical protein
MPPRSKSKKMEQEKHRVGGKTITTKTGPRAVCGNDDHFSKVQDIIDKWTGVNDRGNMEDFYLIQFEGIDDLDSENTDRDAYADYWVSGAAMIDCYQLICNFNKQLEILGKKPIEIAGKTGLYYRSDAELNNIRNDPSSEEEVDSEEGDEPKPRNAPRKRNVSETSEKSSKRNKKATSVATYKNKGEEKMLIGFDRGLPAKAIHGMAFDDKKKTMLYAVEFKGAKRVDFVSSEICSKRCPLLVIDYLVSKLDFPTMTYRELKGYINS